ncbi:hypothetical protein WMO13_04170 [Ignatzschineria larvae DSM 13226]|uniref:Polymer-forming cytoskeletal protein n=1 Tax=Ignatzschineria larvae DSM 13226 TaxID=1111732 RepID=A0ABZ3C1C5_9GAMM|nr:hypothetical protein [Ignatzschineria larvae]
MLLTKEIPLPGTISIDTTEQGGHSGNTTVLKKLIVETAITGDIQVDKTGSLVIKGKVVGDITNYGYLNVEASASIVGTLYNYGKLTLKGSLSEGALYLKSGSHALIHSQQMNKITTISSEANAFVEMISGGGFNVSS